MDGPVYKLERVVQSREGMEDFEGPLDLILFLLGKNKIEIQDIPIALILDQYLDYLALRQKMDLEIASDFIAMAAQLMFIKTRMLLSLEDAEAQSEMDLLIQSLEERKNSALYLCIQRIVPEMSVMSEFGRSIMTKLPESSEQERVYVHTPQELWKAYRAAMERGERAVPPPIGSFSHIVSHEPYPVAAKADEILQKLKALGRTSLHRLFRGNHSRSEVVATFVAVLELCKNRKIQLSDRDDDVTVLPVENAEDVSVYEVLHDT